MSALAPKADMCSAKRHVRFFPNSGHPRSCGLCCSAAFLACENAPSRRHHGQLLAVPRTSAIPTAANASRRARCHSACPIFCSRRPGRCGHSQDFSSPCISRNVATAAGVIRLPPGGVSVCAWSSWLPSRWLRSAADRLDGFKVETKPSQRPDNEGAVGSSCFRPDDL